MHSNTSRLSDRKKKRTPTFHLVGRPAHVSFDHQKTARLEERIEEAALAIQLKAIARAGAPSKFFTIRRIEQFVKKELSSGLARAAENTTSLQTENENEHPISSQILSEQIKWFSRRR